MMVAKKCPSWVDAGYAAETTVPSISRGTLSEEVAKMMRDDVVMPEGKSAS
jgi:hypothetical protein